MFWFVVLTSYYPSVRAVLGNVGPRSWQYGPSAARSVQLVRQSQIVQSAIDSSGTVVP